MFYLLASPLSACALVDRNMNKIYGFEGEVKHKYDDTVMALFTDVFNWLPIAAVISNKPADAGVAWADVSLKSVFVVHGGLSTNVPDPPADSGSEHRVGAVTLASIEAIARGREPPETGLMADLLWSDPQPLLGRCASKVRCDIEETPSTPGYPYILFNMSSS